MTSYFYLTPISTGDMERATFLEIFFPARPSLRNVTLKEGGRGGKISVTELKR